MNDTQHDQDTETTSAPVGPAMDWYIVHTYSGFEDRVVQELTNRIKALGMENHFGEIRVPKETVVEMKSGKRRNVERKFFPGYVLVQMEMSDETWHLVRNTPKVTGFVGGSSKAPVPLTQEEVESILHHTAETKEKPKPRYVYERGEQVQDHRWAVQGVHRARRGHQPRALDAPRPRHDLRPPDSGRARIRSSTEAVDL
jgi:transcriptional antiterminator NusG